MDDNKLKTFIGVKVGSTYSCAAMLNGAAPKTTVIKSCIAYEKNPMDDVVTNTIIGTEVDGSIFPLDKGVIESDDMIEPTSEIVRKLGLPVWSHVVVAVPALELINEKNKGKIRLKKALIDALQPTKMVMFPEVYCGAVKSLGYIKIGGRNQLKAWHSSFLAVNLGSTTTEVLVVIRGNKQYINAFTDVCGNRVDEELADALKNAFGKVIITTPEVKEIKEKFNLTDPGDYTFKVLTKNGMTEISSSLEITNVLNQYAYKVAALIKRILTTSLDSEIVAQILDMPIITTGGMGNITGLVDALELQLRKQLNYDGIVCERQIDGHIAPCLGALMMAPETNWETVV